MYRLSALATVAIAAGSWGWHPEWAVSFGIWGLLALLNWVGLGLVLTALQGPNHLRLGIGIALKLVAFSGLLVVAITRGVEVTSFLAGLHVFLLVALVYGISAVLGRRGSAPEEISLERS